MPEYFPATAQFLADFLNIDVEEVAETTYQNACRFFRLNP